MEGNKLPTQEPLVPGISPALDQEMRVFIAYHARMGMKRRTLQRLLRKRFEKRVKHEQSITKPIDQSPKQSL